MSEKKSKPIDLKNLEPEEKVKYEIAEELGLLIKLWQRDGSLYPQKKQDGSEV